MHSVLAKCEAEGAAIKLEWEDLTEDLLYDTIKMLIEQPRYIFRFKLIFYHKLYLIWFIFDSFKANATRLSRLMKDELVPRKELGVYWVEHVLRHGGTKHLQSSAKDMPFYQRYLLDVAVFLLFLIYIVIYITYLLIRCTISRCFLRPSAAKLKSN